MNCARKHKIWSVFYDLAGRNIEYRLDILSMMNGVLKYIDSESKHIHEFL